MAYAELSRDHGAFRTNNVGSPRHSRAGTKHGRGGRGVKHHHSRVLMARGTLKAPARSMDDTNLVVVKTGSAL